MQLKKSPADKSRSPESLHTEPEKKLKAVKGKSKSSPGRYWPLPLLVTQGPLRLENPADKLSLQSEPHDSILQEYFTVGFGLFFYFN